MPRRSLANVSSIGTQRDVLTPRAQALLAACAASGRLRLDMAHPDSIPRCRGGVPKDLLQYFEGAWDEIGAYSGQILSLLAGNLQPAGAVTDLLGNALLREMSPVEAKRKGVVFTPAWLAARVARNTFLQWRRLHRSGLKPECIADLSCGVGAFLLASQDTFGREPKICGSDVDSLCVAYARMLAWALGSEWRIECTDTLLAHKPSLPLFKPSNDENQQYDILIGNPPFVRSQLLPREYAEDIRRAYPSTAKGNFDLAVAFIEHALSVLRDGGIASYILTNKFMSSAYGELICGRLARDARMLSVDDFQDRQVFPGYTTYTCVLTFARKAPAKRFLMTRFASSPIELGDLGPGTTTSLPHDRLLKHPWDFATGDVHDILRLLRAPSHPLLTDIFGGIVQGVRTGANQVFVVDAASERVFEPGVLAPYVNGEHIRRFSIDTKALRILFPYRFNDFGEVRILGESELRSECPLAWEHLTAHRGVLSARARDSQSPWYAYSRSQNLEIIRMRKLLVREMMPRSEFAADFAGNIVFASGYALDARKMTDEELGMWTAILCTPTMEFSLRHSGTQLQSGWFRLMKHHLRRVRLPLINEDLRREALKVRPDPSCKRRPYGLERLDALVARAFGLSEKQRGVIEDYLEDCHTRSLSERDRQKVAPDRTSFSPSREEALDYEPVRLPQYDRLHCERYDLQRSVTFVPNKTEPIHRWYKYTQAYSAGLVRSLLGELEAREAHLVMDPFAGCGTTGLVCRQEGIPSFGVEVSPLMTWVASVKTSSWDYRELVACLQDVDLPAPCDCRNTSFLATPFADYLSKAFAQGILTQLWSYADFAHRSEWPESVRSFFLMALLGIMEDVSQIRKHGSHYRFMLKTESIGLQKLNTQIIAPEADIRPVLHERIRLMLADVQDAPPIDRSIQCKIVTGDAREACVPEGTVDCVISSPPYLNRNNYIAQQKAEMALLAMVTSKDEYRRLVRRTLRSHVEADFPPGPPTCQFGEVNKIIDTLSLSQNNNPKIPHMIAGYFEDLAQVLMRIQRSLVKGGRAALVLGNSRWGGVVVPVDHIVLLLGERQGLRPRSVLVTRMKGNSPQQMRRYGRIPVRESIVVLEKP